MNVRCISVQSPASMRKAIVVATMLLAATALPYRAAGQCPSDWLPGAGQPGITGDGAVAAMTKWDPDGAGPKSEVLVAVGGFDGAGDVAAHRIATWDGSEWHALGPGDPPGITGQVGTVAVYNGDLIVGGNITMAGGVPVNMIARFDGKAWHPLGSGVSPYPVWTLAVYNGELYAGGLFNDAGGVPVNGIARWNGSTWQTVGSGLSPGAGVTALTVFDGKLIVGGGFTSAGGVPATRFASWDGTTWQSMDGGPITASAPDELAVYNGQLIAGANFFTGGGAFLRSVSVWNGTTWVGLAPGNPTPNDAVFAFQEFEGDLYAGGIFTSAGGVSTPFRMARWNGSNWSAVPGGPGIPGRATASFAIYNGDLIAGGLTSQASGLQASAIGRFDGTSWHYMGTGIDAIVYDIATYNGEVILGGWFSMAGNGVSNGIVRRDSAGQLHALGKGTGISGSDQYVFDMVVYDGRLIVSGAFTAINGVAAPSGIAQWDGASWQPFGNTAIFRKLVHEGELYGVGAFGPNQHVARWNPIAQTWQPIGVFPANAGITCIASFQGDLVAGGIGGIGVDTSVWRWDFDNPAAGWQPVGQHLGFNLVQTLAEYAGELFVGGYEMGLLRFNGTSWVAFGGGLYLGNESPDEILAVFDLRTYQGDLIVAGTFSYAGNQQYQPDAVPVFHLARWNGTNWSAFGEGTNNATVTLHEHDGALFTGGWFQMAGGMPAGYWASWGPTCTEGDANHDGAVNVDDLIAVILGWGACADCGNCPADFDGNCAVNVDDLIAVILNWG
jgi:hypothetical protein